MPSKDYSKIFFIISVISLFLILPTVTFAINYDQKYIFHTQIGDIVINNELYVSVPNSLYDYYQQQSHNTYNIEEYSKFITPNIFRSIALNLENVTNNLVCNDEVLANAVLDIVHQIPYKKSNVKFPIETMIDNSGDCDTLSLLAASIMKAAGLDVVLFLYENSSVSHMNLGVHLSNEPIYDLQESKAFYYEYDNKRYFTAETAGGNWRVGQQPQTYASVIPKIISIENYDNTSFLEISSNLNNPPIPSSISLILNPESLIVEEGETNVTILGSISPRYPNQKVIISLKYESSRFSTYKTVFTDQVGDYSLICSFNVTGKYTIQTSWNGAQNYAGSSSEKLTFNIGLKQLLDIHEVNQTVKVGTEIYQTPSLDSSGKRLLDSQQIKKVFAENFTGEAILVNSEFIIIGSNEPYFTEQAITIPGYARTFVRRGHTLTDWIPEETVMLSNYRQYMNNHLEFMLIQNKKNYSLNVRLLDNSDISEVYDESAFFINASNYVKENMWYNVTARISGNQIIVNLSDENSIYLTKTILVDPNGLSEFKILIKYEPDSIIVLKDLGSELLDQPTQLIGGSSHPVNIPPLQTIDVPELEEQGQQEMIIPEEPSLAEPNEPAEAPLFTLEVTIIAGVIVACSIGIVAFLVLRKRKKTKEFLTPFLVANSQKEKADE